MKKSLIFVLTLLFSLSLFAQSVTNVKSSLYEDMMRWEIMGLSRKLPDVRPYPLNLIYEVLNDVIDSGDAVEEEKAEYYLDSIFTKGIQLSGKVVSHISDNDSKVLEIRPNMYGDLVLTDNIGLSYNAQILATTDRLYPRPLYSGLPSDSFSDCSVAGPFMVVPEVNTVGYAGTTDIYAVFGLNRSNIGPSIYDSLYASPNSFYAPFITFVINKEKWSFTNSMFSITSSTNNASVGQGGGQKYIAFHSFDVKLFDKLSIGYNETITFGKRFDFSYALPGIYMLTQGFYNYRDNLFMGVSVKYNPVSRLNLYLNANVDDLQFNDIVKLKFNTKMTSSYLLGVDYAPEISWLSLLSANYTLVTPWMYSHPELEDSKLSSLNDYNYQNYSHYGYNFGPQIDPNSDRIFLNASFRPVKNMEATLGLTFIRHANINENLPYDEASLYLMSSNEYRTDGTLYDYPYADGIYFPSFQNSMQFLKQETKMYVLQINPNVKYTLDLPYRQKIIFDASYTFEYIRNLGVGNNIFAPNKLAKGSAADERKTAVENAITDWKAKLIKDTFNNFLTVSVKYSW